jgi:hypothetical protein
MLQAGVQVPSYAYAANNPLAYIDPDGLRILGSGSLMKYVDEAESDPIIGPLVRELRADPNYDVHLFDERETLLARVRACLPRGSC